MTVTDADAPVVPPDGRTAQRQPSARSRLPGVGRIAVSIIVPLLLPAGLLLLWEWAATSGSLDARFFPPPSETWASIGDLASGGSLLAETGATVGRAFLAWALSGVIGVAVGLLFGWSRLARAALMPSVEFWRSLPGAAIAPVALLVLGPEPSTEVIAVTVAGIWPVLYNTAAGVVGTEPLLLDASRVCGLNRRAQALKIRIPSAAPAIAAGLRISLWVSLIVAVIFEMVSATGGLGYLLQYASSRYRAEEVFAVVAVLAAIGSVANVGLQLIERRLMRWQG